MFEDADKNRDGYLTNEELFAALKRYNLHEGLSAEDLKNFVRGIDENGDDKIDYEEYVHWMTGKHGSHS